MDNKQILDQNMRNHNLYLSEFATKDSEAIRFSLEEEDMRPAFFRDIDRIIYSMPYTRYMDKTQVFSYTHNDHISKRMVHVQLVSKVARTIGRALSLNEDLIEAASLGHDLGHTPFGHVGESVLNSISKACGEGYFNHNVQSVRLLREIENKGDGSNLTLQVLDAILCHNGEFIGKEYMPRKKNKADFLKEYFSCYEDKSVINNLVPMTLEGCVVRISDMIAYLGRDISDANMLGVFDYKDLPKEIVDVLGFSNKEIINTIIMDVVNNSLHKNSICISDKVYEAMINLKKFNMEHIYKKANDSLDLKHYEDMFQTVFDGSVKAILNDDKTSPIYKDFLKYKNEGYQKRNTANRKAIDYIAGMTDDYLESVYSSYKN